MNISINYKAIQAPYGGGNQFVINFYNYLKKEHNVFFDLRSDKLDFILVVETRDTHNTTYTMRDIFKYLKFKNPTTLVVHRINECDERKKTFLMNFRLRLANYLADHTVVISKYLKTLNVFFNNKKKYITLISNGSNPKIFRYKKKTIKKISTLPIKIVTHHWSPNYRKGHDIYQFIDNLITKQKWKNKIKFTYIGNYPKNLKYYNTSFVKPLHGKKLALELLKHDIYINASINEPGGQSHIEAAMCGLPILYRNSGGIIDTSKNYGVSFNNQEDLERSLKKIINNYAYFKKKLLKYPFTSELCCKNYSRLFNLLIKKKNEYLQKRLQKKNFFMEIFFKYKLFNFFIFESI